LRALKTHEPIAVWGDFDVDGQTATAVLVEALGAISAALGVKPTSPLHYQVPQGNQGHGIYLPALDELLLQGVTLLITCDTGVDALSAVERAARQGCDVIVTDHHDLTDRLPPAMALVNPRRLPGGHPLRELPGVGVAYKLVEHLFQRIGQEDQLQAALDLVALGIVADLATQVADTRYLLQCGLQALRTTKRVGLRALIEHAELRLQGLSEEHVGYQLAPRLNALGRMGDANQGVELFLTQNLARARILAAEMDGLNYQRRLITNQIFQAALSQVEQNPALQDYRALVVAGHNWHAGVLGLVAGRLVERFGRPAVVLCLSEDGKARGSARSVPGCDIVAALRPVSHLLLRFGGHPGAAGLALNAANLEAFRKALSRSVAAVWDAASAAPGLQIDAYISLDQLSLELVGEIERLAPFGPGNPALQLATQDLHVVEDVLVGRDGEHRRLIVADEAGMQQTVVWWQGAGQPVPEGRFDLAYVLRARDYRGEMQLQVEWLAARPHEPAAASSHPARAVVDWRSQAEVYAGLAGLPEGAAAVWAEAEDRDVLERIGGVGRLDLAAAPALVIWTAPPGPAELAYVLQSVRPVTVYLVAHQPPTDEMAVFVERLMGMVKHDLNRRGGQVAVQRLAAALGQRETTVRAGLEWLAAMGQLDIVAADGDVLRLQAGGEPLGNRRSLEARIRRLLDETAAYRRYFRSAPVEALGVTD
jgi:single-stranded-DNA-specific exonuclease